MVDDIVKHLKAFKIPCKLDTDGKGNEIVTGTFQARPFAVTHDRVDKVDEFRVFRGHNMSVDLGGVTSLSQLYKYVQNNV